MKRSKMIYEIANNENFVDKIIHAEDLDDYKKIIKLVLDLAEEAGMEPPLNEDWMSLDECRDYYGDRSTYSDLPRKNINRWSSEDTLD